MHKIVYTATFQKDFKKLDNFIAKRICDKLLEFARKPYNIKPLQYSSKDLPNLCKLRVGDWRVLFWMDNGNKSIILYTVEHRSRIYDNLK